MDSQTHPKTSEVFSKLWPWFFFAAAFQSLLAATALLAVPSEGLSLARLALLGVFAFLSLAGIYFEVRVVDFGDASYQSAPLETPCMKP
jgi:hypothetical protein